MAMPCRRFFQAVCLFPARVFVEQEFLRTLSRKPQQLVIIERAHRMPFRGCRTRNIQADSARLLRQRFAGSGHGSRLGAAQEPYVRRKRAFRARRRREGAGSAAEQRFGRKRNAAEHRRTDGMLLLPRHIPPRAPPPFARLPPSAPRRTGRRAAYTPKRRRNTRRCRRNLRAPVRARADTSPKRPRQKSAAKRRKPQAGCAFRSPPGKSRGRHSRRQAPILHPEWYRKGRYTRRIRPLRAVLTRMRRAFLRFPLPAERLVEQFFIALFPACTHGFRRRHPSETIGALAFAALRLRFPTMNRTAPRDQQGGADKQEDQRKEHIGIEQADRPGKMQQRDKQGAQNGDQHERFPRGQHLFSPRRNLHDPAERIIACQHVGNGSEGRRKRRRRRARASRPPQALSFSAVYPRKTRRPKLRTPLPPLRCSRRCARQTPRARAENSPSPTRRRGEKSF